MDDQPICEHFRAAAEVIGRRWNPELLRVLMDGPARYGRLRAAIPGISDHLLSERLKSLELAGIVSRTVTPDMPVRIEYALTEKGADLTEVVGGLAAWAERWALVPEASA
jgi:DNA-binding HxlR family transcriptional regulator